MPKPNQNYKERVIEQIMMKCNEVIAYGVNGECGGRTVEDCKNELRDFISKALEEQISLFMDSVNAYANNQYDDIKEDLKSKGLI